MDPTTHFLALSPDFASLLTSPPAAPCLTAHDFNFAILPEPNTPNLTLTFPQPSHEYPSLAGSIPPELMQLFGVVPQMPVAPQQQQFSQDVPLSHPPTISFPPEILAQVTTLPSQPTIIPPQLDIKVEPQTWINYMLDPDANPLPFQSSLSMISPQITVGQQQPFPIVPFSAFSPSVPYPTQQPITQEHIKQELAPTPASSAHQLPPTATPQSSALQKLHQRLLQRLRKSQADGPTQSLEQDLQGLGEGDVEPAQNIVVSDASKKADTSFNKVLELFSYYFNTQKTASPLACTAALYLGQVGFELQKRYEAYSRYVKCGVLEEMLVSITRASNLRKLGIKSYEEFLRAEVSELRRIKDPERYLNRRMQVFQSYEPEELEGVYLSFDALYLLAKKPPSFRKEWLEEGKIRIVHICEIHEAWRSSPLNKTKRSRSPSTELEETSDSTAPKVKVLKAEH